MIGKISGRIDYRAADHVMVDVRGVGYVVYVSERTMASLPGPGETAALYTDLQVREDLMQLFGFRSLMEKEWFKLLKSVQGVGAKASMAILSVLGPDGVSRAIALGDWSAVKAAQGVGPKIAQRVVNELKEKAPVVMAMGDRNVANQTAGQHGSEPDFEVVEIAPPAAANVTIGNGAAQAEALSALQNLGYGPGDAAGAVAQAAGQEQAMDTSELIRAALKLLAPKG